MTAELPESVFVIMVHADPENPPSSPDEVRPRPLVLFPGGDGALVTFGDRELAEEFLSSAAFDVPGLIKELPFKRLPELLDLHVEYGQARWLMVDPNPPDRRPLADATGQTYLAEEIAQAIKDELGEGGGR